jgi:DNA polymerase epsilon subunit 1
MPFRKPDRRYGNSFRSAKSSFNPRRTKTVEASNLRASEATSQDEKLQATRLANTIDESMGFARYDSGKKKVGWLINMHSTTMEDDKIPGGRAAVDYYFLEDDGGSFKATVEYDPYFLIAVRKSKEAEVEEWCRRKFEGVVKSIKRIEKEDLQMPNHLLGYRRMFLQLAFENVNDLLGVRKAIMPIAEKNKGSMNAMDTYAEVARYGLWLLLVSLTGADCRSANAGFDLFDDERDNDRRLNGRAEASDYIVDIREFDVPYHVRVAIDKGATTTWD